MNIRLSDVPHQLRFSLSNKAPLKMKNKWKRLKQDCEYGVKKDHNKKVVNEFLKMCELKSNKSLPYLERCEGGFGGNDNQIHKQMRFRDTDSPFQYCTQMDNDIVIDQIYNTESEYWTYAELQDIMQAFVNYFGCPDFVDCVIEIRIK